MARKLTFALLFLAFSAFSTENKEKDEILLHPLKAPEKFSKDLLTLEENVEPAEKKLKTTPKILKQLVLHLVEEYLEPQGSSKMKITDKQWSKLKPRMSSVFPNETAVKIFRDVQTEEIFWADPESLASNQTKREIEICLQQRGKLMSNCLFDFISKWYDVRGENMYIPSEAFPFIKELLYVMSENVEIERLCVVTPIMISARFDAEKAVSKLVERGEEMETVDTDGRTALRIAVDYASASSCRVLLESGANVNTRKTRYYDRTTPLMKAARSGYFEIVKILLEFNADTDEASRLAEQNGHQNCAEVIKVHEPIHAYKAKLKEPNCTKKCTNFCTII